MTTLIDADELRAALDGLDRAGEDERLTAAIAAEAREKWKRTETEQAWQDMKAMQRNNDFAAGRLAIARDVAHRMALPAARAYLRILDANAEAARKAAGERVDADTGEVTR